MDAQIIKGVPLPTIWFIIYQNHIKLFFDRAVDTAGYGKYFVDGFNAFQKWYLATCLRMRSTPEKDNNDSKRMRVEAMTRKGELSFAK